MASQDIGADIVIGQDWSDLTLAYPSLANVPTWVQCRGSVPALVAYSASATAPTQGGYLIGQGDSFGGSAAHIWVRTLNYPTILTAGVAWDGARQCRLCAASRLAHRRHPGAERQPVGAHALGHGLSRSAG